MGLLAAHRIGASAQENLPRLLAQVVVVNADDRCSVFQIFATKVDLVGPKTQTGNGADEGHGCGPQNRALHEREQRAVTENAVRYGKAAHPEKSDTDRAEQGASYCTDAGTGGKTCAVLDGHVAFASVVFHMNPNFVHRHVRVDEGRYGFGDERLVVVGAVDGGVRCGHRFALVIGVAAAATMSRRGLLGNAPCTADATRVSEAAAVRSAIFPLCAEANIVMLNTTRNSLPHFSLALALVAVLAGCAGQQHISRGNKLLATGEYDEAIDAFEAALREAPDSKRARQGITKAQSEAVLSELKSAQLALDRGDLPLALRHGLAARGLPLDLEEVDVGLRVDDMVSEVSRRAEQQVSRWGEAGHLVPAVELADRLVLASPGIKSRQDWRDALRKRAITYYQQLAEDLVGQKLHGSAALQLAMAKKVGAPVPSERIQKIWQRFSGPVCFAAAKIRVRDRHRKLGKRIDDLSQAMARGAAELRAHCGKGTRPLSLTLDIEQADVADVSSTERVVRPLPGSNLKTVETYVEEIPYTVLEEVTVIEKRVEQKERKDCAPRPGKPRGCHTWTDEVEIEVPVTKTMKVEKIRRIERTRPVKDPLPADKILSYEVTSVSRRVALKANLSIKAEGPPMLKTMEFHVGSEDRFHAAAEHPKLQIPADPNEARSMDDLYSELATKIQTTVREALGVAAKVWSKDAIRKAGQRTLQGQMPEAEQLYLGVLALGAEPPAAARTFFSDRYGQPLNDVLAHLVAGLAGDQPKGTDEQVADAATLTFPKAPGSKMPASKAPPGVRVDGEKNTPETAPPKASRAPGKAVIPDVTPVSEEELQEFELEFEDPNDTVGPDESAGGGVAPDTGTKRAM